MTLEEQLKAIILEQYKSIRAFAQEIGVPYSTLDNILKRPNGINNAGVSLMLKIFNALNLDIESTQTGTLTPKMQTEIDPEPLIDAINKVLSEQIKEQICRKLRKNKSE
ncbi:MAG: helix-turn-helix transcriptional regulator [Clostridia bacterium]|nr:helix-turn-helix transcriptional regulator [Clostridia bacterium]